jgi:glutathione S-transferase
MMARDTTQIVSGRRLPDLKLISHDLCPYVQRARIVLIEKHISHELEYIDLAHKPHWFARISPLGKVPVLLSDGRALFESLAITEYLDEVTPGSLHPLESFEKAGNRSWIEFASSTLDAVARFYNARDSAYFADCAEVLRERFRTLNQALDAEPYFNGPNFSLADAAFATLLRYFDVIERHVDIDWFDAMPRLQAWRAALASRPSVRTAVVADYPERLERFFIARGAVLGRLVMGK